MAAKRNIQTLLNLQRSLQSTHSAPESKPPVPSMAKVRGVVIQSLAPFKQPKVPRAGYQAKVQDPDGSKRSHDVRVYVREPELKGLICAADHVQVSCSCEYHLFWGAEFGLNKYGFAEILYGDGSPPVDRNDKYLPVTCIAEGEYVSTSTGLKKIEEVTTADLVKTLQGDFPVAAAVYMGEKTTIKLTTTSGRSLTCTPDHRVYAVVAGEHQARWVEAQDLTTADYLVSFLPANSVNPPPACTSQLVLHVPSSDIVGFDQITLITDAGVKKVYDLDVPGPEHFVASGFVVHNCKHVHAVLLELYRKKL